MHKITSYGELNSAWLKDFTDTLGVNIGRMGQKLFECMSNFDLLVVLERLGWQPQIRCEGLWDCPESVCQISQLFTTAFYGLP